jgi:hypothetical protein
MSGFFLYMSENLLGISPKLITRTIHSIRLIFAMKILIGTNAEYTRNVSHGLIPTF